MANISQSTPAVQPDAGNVPGAAQPSAPPAADAAANETLASALAYLRGGLSLVPIARGGSKAPVGRLLPRELRQDGQLHPTWKPFESRLPTEDEARGWFSQVRPPGIATLQGRVSGNAELIDFDHDAETIFPAWCWLVEAEAPGLLDRLNVVKTPRPGYHVRYRCPEVDIPGNDDLAVEPYTDPSTGRPKKHVLIQTRGEGGYALAPGSPPECHETGRPYVHHSGPPLDNLLDIRATERETLWRAARSFDRTPPAGEEAGPQPTAGRNGELRPGEDFSRRGPDWQEILAPHGWALARQVGAARYWRRPGKDGGWSATTGVCTSKRGWELLAVFSSNAAPFEGPANGKPCSCYSRFAAFALLNHAGDFAAAARELRRQGYGGGKTGRGKGKARGRGGSRKRPPGEADGLTGYDIILEWFRNHYQPTHKRGTSIFTAKGEVKVGVALGGAPIKLIDRLAEASDAPLRRDQSVNRDALPQFFNTWGRSAWADLLGELDEEEEAAEVSDAEREHFRQRLADVLHHQESFGRSIKGKYGHDETKVERRSLISWCNLWAKAGWAPVRSLNLWCRRVAGELEVALRRELFTQVSFGDLAGLTASKLTRRCERYDVGRGGFVLSQRVIILEPDFVEIAVAVCLQEPADGGDGEPAPGAGRRRDREPGQEG